MITDNDVIIFTSMMQVVGKLRFIRMFDYRVLKMNLGKDILINIDLGRWTKNTFTNDMFESKHQFRESPWDLKD